MRARNLFLVFLLLILAQSFGLNIDGLLLLSFKYSIMGDPMGALAGWNSRDETPCSWNGVSCGSGEADFRVTGLALPNSGLAGSLPATLGIIQHLQHLDLSNNSINASIPLTLFNASELEFLDLSNNLLSGTLPELIGKLQNLRVLNLSENALVGRLPLNLSRMPNLEAVSLRNNYFSGSILAAFNSVEVLDLSSNLINGSLPVDFSGGRISYLNASYNRISGEIPAGFAARIPTNATVDLSFNNLTGRVPASQIFLNQATSSFAGNELCGEPLKKPCSVVSPQPESPPAIAVIPQTIASNPAIPSSSGHPREKRTGLRPKTILAIVVGDVAGIGIIAMVFLYIVYMRKRKGEKINKNGERGKEFDWEASSAASNSEEYNWLRTWTCLKKQRHAHNQREESSPESTGSEQEKSSENPYRDEMKGALVTVDGERELELEALLKASAYILGASGSSIMYKAVLEDGTTMAVRRIGDDGVERFKDFENQIRIVAKLVHPNLVQVRGFYWGVDEKLIIYDFVPNGSLANARYRKAGCSPCPLPWEMRLKIAIGVARGLSYIHEKKHVHGNLKPSNILLGREMEPKIGDFGLERLVVGDTGSSKPSGSARNFGSKRSTASRESFQDLATPSPSSSVIGVSPYHAPESLRSLKPHPKWDVFSFGVVLLELLTGKVIVSDETAPSLAIGAALAEEDKGKVLRMADAAIRAEVEGREDALLALIRLGYGCISPVPQKRPSMKEALHTLERSPICSYS